MNYDDLIEDVELYNKTWKRIKGDHAFSCVLDDWYNGQKEVYFKYLKDTMIVVQAGGFCGIYPRLFGEVFQAVYTFEPDPLNFFCLTLNCQSNNIIKTQGALGKQHEMVSVDRTCETNKGMNKVKANNKAMLPTYMIDDLNLIDCNLIQLDTEGYEYNILQGATNTISKFKPVISVEDSTEEINNLLFDFGYKEMKTVKRDTVFVA